MSKELENLAIDIKSIIISAPGGRTLQEISVDFQTINKKPLPCKEYGYRSEKEMLDDLVRMGQLCFRNGRYNITADASSGAEHLIQLIRTQRGGKVSNFVSKGQPAASAGASSRNRSNRQKPKQPVYTLPPVTAPRWGNTPQAHQQQPARFSGRGHAMSYGKPPPQHSFTQNMAYQMNVPKQWISMRKAPQSPPRRSEIVPKFPPPVQSNQKRPVPAPILQSEKRDVDPVLVGHVYCCPPAESSVPNHQGEGSGRKPAGSSQQGLKSATSPVSSKSEAVDTRETPNPLLAAFVGGLNHVLDHLVSKEQDRSAPVLTYSLTRIIDENPLLRGHEAEFTQFVEEKSRKPHAIFQLAGALLTLTPIARIFPDLELSIRQSKEQKVELDLLFTAWRAENEQSRAVLVREIKASSLFTILQTESRLVVALNPKARESISETKILCTADLSHQEEEADFANMWIEVQPTHILSPTHFFFRVSESELSPELDRMNAFYEKHAGKPELKEFVGRYCCVHVDGRWCRAEILSQAQGTLAVRLVDSGRLEQVQIEEARILLRLFHQIPALAHRGKLLPAPSSEGWTAEATEVFREFVSSGVLWAFPTERTVDLYGVSEVVLADFCKMVDGDEVMLSREMALEAGGSVKEERREEEAREVHHGKAFEYDKWTRELEDDLPDF